ncbi:DUF6056 family protein [Butyrivibrio sp. FC2001]|uniref:DUF6056 family protein n=1 Tax=Butyrivibrio sp. FC2001 TaxID=1280671 RepID=UPI0003F8560F|nr:DUF6056 family protein [Butyrivibrio sp. FC2001]
MSNRRSFFERGFVFFWICLFIFLLVQNSFIWLYFDDYGYASLTYLGSDFNRTGGTGYSFGQLLGFLQYHYLHWGGRVTGFFMEILAMKHSVWVIRIIQAVLTLCLLLFSYKIVCFDNNRKWEASFIIIAFFFLMGISTVNWGTMWFSASVAYLWSAAFFVIAVYLQLKLLQDDFDNNKNRTACAILCTCLFALAASMHEQSSVAVICYVFLTDIVYYLLERNKIKAENIWRMFFSIVGGAFCIMAPGNIERAVASRYDAFSSMTVLGKVKHNLPLVLMINLDDSIGITSLLAISNILAAIIILKKLSGKTRVKSVILRVNILVGIILGIIVIGCSIYQNRPLGKQIFEGLWVCIFVINVSIFMFICNKKHILAIFISGIMTQVMMLFSPDLNFRVHIFFVFCLGITCACIISESVKDYRVLVRGIAVLAIVYGIITSMNLTVGYWRNNKINNLNDMIMRDAAKSIAKGNTVESIRLYKLVDDKYACVMPYQEGFESANGLMKNYYMIPGDISIIWEEYGEQ